MNVNIFPISPGTLTYSQNNNGPFNYIFYGELQMPKVKQCPTGFRILNSLLIDFVYYDFWTLKN